MTETRVLIGHVDVDAGLVWVGDPCYIMGDDASGRVTSWSDFVDTMYREDSTMEDKCFQSYTHENGHGGRGIAVGTFWGDGTYPVYATYREQMRGRQRIAKLEVIFDGSDGEEE